MAVNETRKHPDRRRLGLRGMMILVALIALGLVVILPRFSDRLHVFERYVRIRLAEDDMNRHCNAAAIRQLADDFALAVQSGRAEDALELTSAEFRKRTSPERLRTLATEVGLDRGPSELVEATLTFSDRQNRFVAEYALRCGPETGPNRAVKLVVIAEGGSLKVDRVEPGSK